MQYDSYISTQQQEMNIRKLYHDIGNHIKTIEVLVSRGENQKAIEYTERLSEQYKIINHYHFCNNKIINAVLSQKIKECEQHGISHTVDAPIPDQITSKHHTFITTKKKDKSMHGYGLRIVKDIVKRYDGKHEITDHGSTFSAMVMLNMYSDTSLSTYSGLIFLEMNCT